MQNIAYGSKNWHWGSCRLANRKMTQSLVRTWNACYWHSISHMQMDTAYALEKFGKSLLEVEKCRNMFVCGATIWQINDLLDGIECTCRDYFY